MPGRLPFVSRSRKLLRIPYPAADPARVESCRGSGCLRFNLYGSIRAKLPAYAGMAAGMLPQRQPEKAKRLGFEHQTP